MFVSRMDIENFGPFSDRVLDGLTPGLNVFYGPNEAGKSALRAFLRTVMFGFLPGTRSQDVLDLFSYPPMGGGAAAGAITLVSSTGRSYVVRRTEGPRGGPVTVTGDAPGGADQLDALLGRVTADLYHKVFSISLTEVERQRLESDKQIGEQIYSASLGVANLPTASRSLDEKRSSAGGLWSSRAGVLRTTFRELADAKSALLQVQEEQGEYGSLVARIAARGARIEAETSRLRRLRADRERLQTLTELRPRWELQNEVLRRIDGLPAGSDFPTDGLDRLERALEVARRAQERLTEANRLAGERAHATRTAGVVPSFTSHEAQIQRLSREIEHYREGGNDLPGLQERLGTAQATLRVGLEALGPEWDESKLGDAVDLDSLQDVLSELGERRDHAAQTLADAERDAAAHDSRLQEAQERTERAEERRDALAPVSGASAESLQASRRRLETLRAAVTEQAGTERELRDLEVRLADLRSRAANEGVGGRQRRVPALVPAAAVAAGVAMAAWGVASGEASGAVAGTGLAVAGIGLLVLDARAVRRSASESETGGPANDPVPSVLLQQTEQLRKRDATAVEITGLLAELGFESAPTERDVVERISAASAELEARLEYDRRVAATLEAGSELRDVRAACEAPRRACTEAGVALKAAGEEWVGALRAASLNERLDRIGALQAVSDIRDLRRQAGAIAELNDRVGAISRMLEDVETRVRPVLEPTAIQGFQPGHALPALEQLDEAFRAHQRGVRDNENRARLDREWEAERQGLVQAIEESDGTQTALLRAAGAVDEETFRTLAAQAAERLELEGRLHALHEDRPLLVSDAGASYRKELDESSADETVARAAEIADEIERAEETLRDLHAEHGAAAADRDRLEASNPTAALHAGIAELVERAAEQGRRWAVLTVARHVLDGARDEFQRDRQAPLLQAASAYFSRFTDRRYESVQAVLGEQTLQVVEAGRARVKEVAELSRGTREQLYLALRFAMIDQMSARGEPLPVLMDDVMVNFDPERAAGACSAVVQFAQRHQVLVLTCHPHTVAAFKDAARAAGTPAPHLVDL